MRPRNAQTPCPCPQPQLGAGSAAALDLTRSFPAQQQRGATRHADPNGAATALCRSVQRDAPARAAAAGRACARRTVSTRATWLSSSSSHLSARHSFFRNVSPSASSTAPGLRASRFAATTCRGVIISGCPVHFQANLANGPCQSLQLLEMCKDGYLEERLRSCTCAIRQPACAPGTPLHQRSPPASAAAPEPPQTPASAKHPPSSPCQTASGAPDRLRAAPPWRRPWPPPGCAAPPRPRARRLQEAPPPGALQGGSRRAAPGRRQAEAHPQARHCSLPPPRLQPCQQPYHPRPPRRQAPLLVRPPPVHSPPPFRRRAQAPMAPGLPVNRSRPRRPPRPPPPPHRSLRLRSRPPRAGPARLLAAQAGPPPARLPRQPQPLQGRRPQASRPPAPTAQQQAGPQQSPRGWPRPAALQRRPLPHLPHPRP